MGGSYTTGNRRLLDDIAEAIQGARLVPIVADRYALLQQERDVHDVTLWLLHACRLAVFEVSTLSGALMEIERLRDFGVKKALLLYHDPARRVWPEDGRAWHTTQMLKSLALEQAGVMSVRPYARPQEAVQETKAFVRAVRRSVYGKLHGF